MNMRKYVLFWGIILFILQSCGLNEKKRIEEKKRRDSLEIVVAEYIRKLELEPIEEKIALGDIMFGISESVFNEKRVSFESKCKLSKPEIYTTKNYKLEHISHELNYKLGEYGFTGIDGWFCKDSLYTVILYGFAIDNDDYDILMQNQYNALFSVLLEKYGKPLINNGFPSLNSIEIGYAGYYTKPLCIWKIGKKKIEIHILRGNTWQELNLFVYLPEILKKVNQQYHQEQQKKELETAKKGADIL